MEEVLDGIIKIFKDSQRTKLPSPNCSSVYYAIKILYSNVRRKKKTEKEWVKEIVTKAVTGKYESHKHFVYSFFGWNWGQGREGLTMYQALLQARVWLGIHSLHQ